MRIISNFAELYYSDQLPTELHDWFVIEDCDREWNFYSSFEQHEIPSILDGLQARYGISLGKVSNCPRGNFYERNKCQSEIDCLLYWKDIKKFHTLHKTNIREDCNYLNKLIFFWWERSSSSLDIGYAIRKVNQSCSKYRKKDFIQKEIDRWETSLKFTRKSFSFKNLLLKEEN